MGGHFDAVGFGDPSLGFEATRRHLRSAVEAGRLVGRAGEILYYELETPEGCGLTAATDDAGFLLNGCPYFRGQHSEALIVDALGPWDQAEPDQGGALGYLPAGDGGRGPQIRFALPCFALEAAAGLAGEQRMNLVGLGYRAVSFASDRRLPPDGRPHAYFQPASGQTSLPAIRRCNVNCRGRIERAAFLTNSRTGARLAYALLDCDGARLEVVIDLPSLSGGLAEGAYLEGSFWLVGRPISR